MNLNRRQFMQALVAAAGVAALPAAPVMAGVASAEAPVIELAEPEYEDIVLAESNALRPWQIRINGQDYSAQSMDLQCNIPSIPTFDGNWIPGKANWSLDFITTDQRAMSLPGEVFFEVGTMDVAYGGKGWLRLHSAQSLVPVNQKASILYNCMIQISQIERYVIAH